MAMPLKSTRPRTAAAPTDIPIMAPVLIVRKGAFEWISVCAGDADWVAVEMAKDFDGEEFDPEVVAEKELVLVKVCEEVNISGLPMMVMVVPATSENFLSQHATSVVFALQHHSLWPQDSNWVPLLGMSS